MLAAIGVLVVVGCAALGAEVAARVDDRAAYLAVATYVPQGSVIVPGDLAVVTMTWASGLAAIPSAAKDSVLGRRASEPLEPGSLLVPDDLSGSLPLPDGDALVGTSLSTSQAPAGLAPGVSVIVVLGGPSSDVSTGSSDPSGRWARVHPTRPATASLQSGPCTPSTWNRQAIRPPDPTTSS